MVKPCASRLPGYLNGYFLRTISTINKLKNVKAKPKHGRVTYDFQVLRTFQSRRPQAIPNSLGWIVFFECLPVPFPSPPTLYFIHHGQLLVLVPRRLCLIMLTK